MREYHDIGVEQQLLGAILMNNTAFAVVDDIVKPDHFFEPLHREIWKLCASMIGAGKLVSPVTLRSLLPAETKVADMSLREYVALLAAESTTIVNAPDFARIVRDLADRRLIIEVGTELQHSVEGDNLALSAWAVDYLDGIVAAQSMNAAPALDMDKAVDRALEAAATAYQREGKPRGLSYGLAVLDQKTLGAMPGDLVVIAGRPGMGKTAFALSILRNMAIQAERCLFVSLEMGDVALTNRVIVDEMWAPSRRFSYWQLASGKYHESIFQRVRDAADRVRKWPIRIEQQPGLTIAQIGARARQYKRRYGLKALFVDHIGLVKASERYAGNKVNETGEITMGLKALAKELGIPVFALSQINRGVEQREDKRPSLGDLRNSGDIEQDADTVLILYRPAYYHQKKEPLAGSAEFIIWSDEMAKIENRLDCSIEKQRSGPTGVVRLYVDIACNAVRDEISEMDDSLMLPGERMGDFA